MEQKLRIIHDSQRLAPRPKANHVTFTCDQDKLLIIRTDREFSRYVLDVLMYSISLKTQIIWNVLRYPGLHLTGVSIKHALDVPGVYRVSLCT